MECFSIDQNRSSLVKFTKLKAMCSNHWVNFGGGNANNASPFVFHILQSADKNSYARQKKKRQKLSVKKNEE